MERKGVLEQAIKMLEKSNEALLLKMREHKPNSNEYQNIKQVIARNNSMILDYKFRLNNK